jgi:hypothetical protein
MGLESAWILRLDGFQHVIILSFGSHDAPGFNGLVGHLSREPVKVTYFKIIIKLYPLINKS